MARRPPLAVVPLPAAARAAPPAAILPGPDRVLDSAAMLTGWSVPVEGDRIAAGPARSGW